MSLTRSVAAAGGVVDGGATWSRMTAIEGTGCARPRLLSLGVGKPLIMSGGRMCVENMTGTEPTPPEPLPPTGTPTAAAAAAAASASCPA